MTATEGCIDAPHDHVDQCHQAGRAEVEAKYAALVAAVEGLALRGVTGFDLMPTISGQEDVVWWYGYLRRLDEFWRARLRAVLAEHADPAEGGDR